MNLDFTLISYFLGEILHGLKQIQSFSFAVQDHRGSMAKYDQKGGKWPYIQIE